MRSARWLPAIAVALLASCTGGDGDEDAAPGSSTTTEPGAPTTVIDYSGVLLAPVQGETTTTVVTSGSMVLNGTVHGPGGPVAGATVRIERILPSGRAEPVDVGTDGTGRYELRGVPGGRYRIRAFQPPSFIQAEPVIEFLADREEHEIDLDVDQVGGLVVLSAAAPSPPTLGNPVNVVVQVVVRQVDEDGIVRGAPQAGLTLELTGIGEWVPVTASGAGTTSTSTSTSTSTTALGSAPRSLTATTDSTGRARFALRCVRTGDPGLSVSVPVAAGPGGVPATSPHVERLDLPACVDPSATTTTTTTSTIATSSSATSSTAPPQG